MTRIGVICEGPTDFLAISSFLKMSLGSRGFEVDFIDVQPELDATAIASGGGWPNALSWLVENPLATRLTAYLGAGLFASGLSKKRCDFLIVQIDTDVLDEDHFRNFVLKKKQLVVGSPVDPAGRFDEVQKALFAFCELKNEADADSNRHVVAPAVENTETWCVSARQPDVPDVEKLSKSRISAEFLARLMASEAGTTLRGSMKNIERRRAYCDAHKAEHSRVEMQCSQYSRLVEGLDRILK